MKALFKSHPYASTGFLLGAAVTLFFLIRITSSAIYWSQHQEEVVKPWMTVGYIAKSWGLDPAQIDALTGFPSPKGHGPWTMKQIAAARGVTVDEVIQQVTQTIATLNRAKPKAKP
jgi:hypothetical protein